MSWALEAIEKEAMIRARQELSSMTTFSFMGYSREQIIRIIMETQARYSILPTMTDEELKTRLRS